MREHLARPEYLMPPITITVFWQILFGLYLLATFVQLVAWWGVYGQLIFSKRTLTSSPLTSSPLTSSLHHPSPASIILCARNEAQNLRRNLPVILNQQYDAPWELLVIDDASADETPLVLQSFEEKYPNRLRVLRIPVKSSPGKKQALTQGIAAAKYDLILLTDADCVPNSTSWLALMVGMLTAKPATEIVLGYGPVLGAPFSRFETAFIAAQYFAFACMGMPYMGVGRNLAFKRPVFDRVGGFMHHAHLASGDDDLLVNMAANTRNTAICLSAESFVYSDAPPGLAAWFQQKRRHLSVGGAYRWTHKLPLAMLALSLVGHYFLFSVLILSGFNTYWVLGMFLIRQISVLIVFGKILRKLRESDLVSRIPLYDILLAVYYGALVPYFLLKGKQVDWR